MNICKSMPDHLVTKAARAPSGMRCFINGKWNLVTHRGVFRNGEKFIIFRVARYQFSIAYGNIASITKTTKPSNADPIFVYEHFVRWKKAAQGIGTPSQPAQYLKETEYNAEELQYSLNLIDKAEKFMRERKVNTTQSKPSPCNGTR
ncbi:hypothetical protein [Vibrio diazotrophicus]|uniref:hypothetical protein n=1 Tax=Vibrio diazotrophicus TaxID=685 RepID=UPI00142E7AA3|nr:hypothetical protein [Vibrio diazotrophicus]NIY92581.1 hypothetical protein [Vibrio diazotrophicus]